MCGIWAIFGSDEDVSKHIMSCMCISHRGPDAFRMENINHFKNCALGFHRLAIVEDMQGMQPFQLHQYPHLLLCYNGEIYNHKLVGEQHGFQYETGLDGECILHLYARGGAEYAAAHLDGVFAFVILDCAKRLVCVGRDTYGVRPVFREKGFLAICSEVKGIQGLAHDVYGNQEKVTHAQPGHVSTYSLDQHGKASLIDEVEFHYPGKAPRFTTAITSYSGNVLKDIQDLLSEAVKKRMMGVRRIGCLLSGGLDSSLITSLVVKHAKDLHVPYRIQTFAVGMDGSPDVIAARKVARHLGTEHFEVTFTPDEGIKAISDVIKHNESFEIILIRASVGMYLLCQHISKKTDNVIIFSGEGSDELTQGYIHFHKAPSPAEADKESRRLLRDLYLHENLRADRMTSAHGLELRVPFLDHQLTHYYLSQPLESRIPKNGIEKHLLRSAFAETSLIPDEILWRPKEGFSDGVSSHEKSWFSYLQDYVETQVTDSELANAAQLYPQSTPKTKEGYYYRKIFESFYPGQHQLTPYMWMPKWIEATDPSARTLKHYKDTKVDAD